jgi:hypothetical protein
VDAKHDQAINLNDEIRIIKNFVGKIRPNLFDPNDINAGQVPNTNQPVGEGKNRVNKCELITIPCKLQLLPTVIKIGANKVLHGTLTSSDSATSDD